MLSVSAALIPFVVLLSTAASSQTAACIASAEIACTDQGAVRGVVQGATMAFKGTICGPTGRFVAMDAARTGSTMGWRPRRQPFRRNVSANHR
jgi:hypothetical protein